MSIHYASGLARAARAHPQLAAEAVERALSRLGQPRAASLLLFLTADFAQDPRPALVAAARAAQTLAVTGCTALGVFNEDDWVVDAPAACVLAWDEPQPAVAGPRLSLAAPNAIDIAWLETATPRYGGIAGDATGLGPYKVWRQGQLVPDGCCDLALPPAQLGLSRGMALISPPYRVTDSAGFDLKTLDGRLASATLRRTQNHLPPLHELGLATLDDRDQPLGCWPIVSLNPDCGVTVAAQLFPGQRVAWVQRSADTALAEMRALTEAPSPAAALMFSCASRGAALHGGLDREWQTVVERWPGTPLAGFYGNGQISHQGGANRLLHQSVILAGLPG
ncbi:FIST C-terminal domain-containing protein [Chitinimonas sp.]|uniref:FIST C-terminal domain-containing protein n=1 Tax=Chitinimonas sp. TaxID=1934313 RepID=UPI002F92B8F7